MIHLPGILAAAVEVQAFCENEGWHFCFIRSELKPLLQLKEQSEALDKLEEKLALVERRCHAKLEV